MGLFGRNKTVQGSSDGPEVPRRKKIVRVTIERDGRISQHDLGVNPGQENMVNVNYEMTNIYGRNVIVRDAKVIGEENA